MKQYKNICEVSMEKKALPSFMNADLHGKTVLVRVDHNVVKKGKVKDAMRIDATIPTILHIYRKGGRPILMTHVGRPYDKKTGNYTLSPDEDVAPIVKYLEHKLNLKIVVPELPTTETDGIKDLGKLMEYVARLKKGEFMMLYLPNTRWFNGEESKEEAAETFAEELSRLAEVYVNDAFGSWQPHVSTYHITKYLPSYAGLLMEKEIKHLEQVFEPRRPLVSVVAGSKFDTKIGPLSSLIQMSDKLVLGGVLYNAYLAAKYGVSIAGLGEDDIALADKFIEDSKAYIDRIVELPYIVESDSFEEITAGSTRTHKVADLKPGQKLNFILDAGSECYGDPAVKAVFETAGTVFVNAVMGYTALFKDGTKGMYSLIDTNKTALKLFGGGDTIQDFKDILPGTWMKAANDPLYYFFTGGGAILDAIVQGSPYGMKPVQALVNK
jgi:phosphoglycerate kinase